MVSELMDSGTIVRCRFIRDEGTTVGQRQPRRIGPGFVLGDRYQLRRLLGKGGMGQVFLAYDQRDRHRVAIKLLLDDRPLTSAVERITREAQSIGRIQHENIVTITDVGQSPRGGIYFVMEFLKGEELAATLHREGPMPWRRVRHIALQICAGLRAAHDAGIVHRDLKLQNCFRIRQADDLDFVKILDFGIAKLLVPQDDEERLTHTGAALGTPCYMAPEQCRGHRIDHRVDIYALGTVMYELLTGTTPFTGDSFVDVAQLHINEPVPPMATFVGNRVPVVFEDIVMQALAKRPEHRFQTMATLATALRELGERGEASSQRRAAFRPPSATISQAEHTMEDLSLPAKTEVPSPVNDRRQPKGAIVYTLVDQIETLRSHAIDARIWEQGDSYARVWRLTPTAILNEYGGHFTAEGTSLVASAVAEFVDDGVTTIFVEPSKMRDYHAPGREKIFKMIRARKDRIEAIHVNLDGTIWIAQIVVSIMSAFTKVVHRHRSRAAFEAALLAAVNQEPPPAAHG